MDLEKKIEGKSREEQIRLVKEEIRNRDVLIRHYQVVVTDKNELEAYEALANKVKSNMRLGTCSIPLWLYVFFKYNTLPYAGVKLTWVTILLSWSCYMSILNSDALDKQQRVLFPKYFGHLSESQL